MKKLVFICICFPSMLFAQQQRVDTSRIYTIPEITVTESYKIHDVRSAVPMQTFSNKQLNLLNALQLSDAVKHFSGVTVKDYGGIGGLKTVSIRSLGAEHTAVSYDGVTITDSQTGQIDIGRYSLENIDHLSLSIGQNDNIFQPARLFSSAGILNIYTLTPRFKDGSITQGSASLKTGSLGFINPFFLLEQKIAKRWSATANAEWMSADGRYPFLLHYTNQNDDLTSKEKRHNTEVRNLRLETELFGNFSNNEQFRLKMYYYQSSRGLPGATTYYYNHSSQHQWDKNLFVQSYYQKDINRKWAFMSSAKWNWSYTHYLDPDYLNSEGKTENSYFQREYYLTSSLLFRAFDNLSLSLSSDESINKLNANLSDFAFPTRFTWLSSFAIKYANRYITASSSLLATLTNEQVKNGSAGDNHHRLSPFVSLSYHPFSNEDFTIRAFYKDIFRLPTFNDLYYGAIGYRGLKPEKTKQSNLGITYGKKGLGIISFFSASADAYYNKVREKIIAVPTKNLFIWSMVNLGKVDMKGLDIDGSLSLAPIKDWQMDLSGNYSYLRAIDKTDSNSKTYNQQIAYTPRVSASGQCAIISPWITLSYSFIHSGKRYMLGQNLKENRLNGYNDSSISARKSFKWNKMTCSTAIEVLNIMNKNYEIVKNFPMPGRSFRLTLTIKR
jgi:vitamin B12 transporter